MSLLWSQIEVWLVIFYFIADLVSNASDRKYGGMILPFGWEGDVVEEEEVESGEVLVGEGDVSNEWERDGGVEGGNDARNEGSERRLSRPSRSSSNEDEKIDIQRDIPPHLDFTSRVQSRIKGVDSKGSGNGRSNGIKRFCKPCEKQFGSEIAFLQHSQDVHVVRTRSESRASARPGRIPSPQYAVPDVRPTGRESLCDVCPEAFANQWEVRKHKTAHHPWAVLCKACVIGFLNARQALAHYQDTHDCRDTEPERIQAVLDSLQTRRVLDDILDVQRLHACEECQEEFGSQWELERHQSDLFAHGLKEDDKEPHFPPLGGSTGPPRSSLLLPTSAPRAASPATQSSTSVSETPSNLLDDDVFDLYSGSDITPPSSEQSYDWDESTAHDLRSASAQPIPNDTVEDPSGWTSTVKATPSRFKAQDRSFRDSHRSRDGSDHPASLKTQNPGETRRTLRFSRSEAFEEEQRLSGGIEEQLPSFLFPTKDETFQTYPTPSSRLDSMPDPEEEVYMPDDHPYARPTPRPDPVSVKSKPTSNSSWSNPLVQKQIEPVLPLNTLAAIARRPRPDRESVSNKKSKSQRRGGSSPPLQPVFESGWQTVATGPAIKGRGGRKVIEAGTFVGESTWSGKIQWGQVGAAAVDENGEDPYGGW